MPDNDQLKNLLNNVNTDPNEIEVCGICGSPDIEIRMWVSVNTNEVKGPCDDNETYCNLCEEIIRLADLTTMTKFDEEKERNIARGEKERLAETPLDETVLGAILNSDD